MASGMYTASFERFFGGDIDYVNDRLSVLLVDTTLYTADLANDTTIADIPDAAILAETLLEGKFIDVLQLFADPSVFSSVEDIGQTAGAVVVYVDATTTTESYLFLYFTDDTLFPITPTGNNITVTWPVDGLLQATA